MWEKPWENMRIPRKYNEKHLTFNQVVRGSSPRCFITENKAKILIN